MIDSVYHAGESGAILITPRTDGFYMYTYFDPADLTITADALVSGATIQTTKNLPYYLYDNIYRTRIDILIQPGNKVYDQTNAGKLNGYVASIKSGAAVLATYSGGVYPYQSYKPSDRIGRESTEFPIPIGTYITADGQTPGYTQVAPAADNYALFEDGVYYNVPNNQILVVTTPVQPVSEGGLVLVVANTMRRGSGVVFKGPWLVEGASKHAMVAYNQYDGETWTPTADVYAPSHDAELSNIGSTWTVTIAGHTYTAQEQTFQNSVTYTQPPHRNWSSGDDRKNVHGDNALMVSGSRVFHTVGYLTEDPSVIVYDESDNDDAVLLWSRPGHSDYVLRSVGNPASTLIDEKYVKSITCAAVTYYPMNGISTSNAACPVAGLMGSDGMSNTAIFNAFYGLKIADEYDHVLVVGDAATRYYPTYFNFNPDIITDYSSDYRRNIYFSSSCSHYMLTTASSGYYGHYHSNTSETTYELRPYIKATYAVSSGNQGEGIPGLYSIAGEGKNWTVFTAHSSGGNVIYASGGSFHVESTWGITTFSSGLDAVLYGIQGGDWLYGHRNGGSILNPYTVTYSHCPLEGGDCDPPITYEMGATTNPIGEIRIRPCIPMLQVVINGTVEQALDGDDSNSAVLEDVWDESVEQEGDEAIHSFSATLQRQETQRTSGAQVIAPSEINYSIELYSSGAVVAGPNDNPDTIKLIGIYNAEVSSQTGPFPGPVTLDADWGEVSWIVPPFPGGNCDGSGIASSGASLTLTCEYLAQGLVSSGRHWATMRSDFVTSGGCIYSGAGLLQSTLDTAAPVFPYLYSGYQGVYQDGVNGSFTCKPVVNSDYSATHRWFAYDYDKAGGGQEITSSLSELDSRHVVFSSGGSIFGDKPLTGSISGGILKTTNAPEWQMSGYQAGSANECIYPISSGASLCRFNYNAPDTRYVLANSGAVYATISASSYECPPNETPYPYQETVTATGYTYTYIEPVAFKFNPQQPVISGADVHLFDWLHFQGGRDDSNISGALITIDKRLQVYAAGWHGKVVGMACYAHEYDYPSYHGYITFNAADNEEAHVKGDAKLTLTYDDSTSKYTASASYRRIDGEGIITDLIDMPARSIDSLDTQGMADALASGAAIYAHAEQLIPIADQIKADYALNSTGVDAVAANSAVNKGSGGSYCRFEYRIDSTAILQSGAVVFHQSSADT